MKISRILKISVLSLMILTSCTNGVKLSELTLKDKLYYKVDEQKPFTGSVHEAFLTGKDSLVASIANGLYNGDYLIYYPTGEIKDSVVYDKGIIVKYKRLLISGLELKIPEKLLFQSKNGLTCIIDENKDTVIFSGLSIKYKNNKSIDETTNYINGKLNGKRSVFHPNGNLYYSQEYKNGNLQGKEITYYDNGTLQEEGNYSNGSRTGKWTTYYKNKKIDEVGIYRNGSKDSTWNEYYENGNKELISSYSNGIKNGNYIAFYENGNFKAKGSFQNNMREGDWTFYSSDGSVNGQQRFSRGNALSKCDCCGNFYNYDEGWTGLPRGFSSGYWDFLTPSGGPYCSKGCARRCD